MSKINIEEIVKSKLDNYEMSYDNSWNEFEKKLNKNKVSYKNYYIAAAAVLIIGLLSIPFLNNTEIKEDKNTTVIASQENNNLKNEKQVTSIISEEIVSENDKSTTKSISEVENINPQVQESDNNETEDKTENTNVIVSNDEQNINNEVEQETIADIEVNKENLDRIGPYTDFKTALDAEIGE